MKILYCWRCKMELPMLDEDEFAVVKKLYSEGIRATKDYRQRYGVGLAEVPHDEPFRPVREAYQQITGFEESNHNAIMHHRIAIYGPPCETCGKPLRTPRANLCAAPNRPRIGSPDQ